MSEGTAQVPAIAKPRHLPYQIDPNADRTLFYENYWKKVALELLLKHQAPQGKTLLDYGCGRGETLQIFGQAGFQVKGTDVDPECVRLSSQYGPAAVLQPDQVLARVGTRSFDVHTWFRVLV